MRALVDHLAIMFGFLGAAFGRLGTSSSGGEGAPPPAEDLPHFTIIF